MIAELVERTNLPLEEIRKLDRLTIQLVYLRRRDKDGILPSTKMVPNTVTKQTAKQAFIDKLLEKEVPLSEAEYLWEVELEREKETKLISESKNYVANLQKYLLPRSCKPIPRRNDTT